MSFNIGDRVALSDQFKSSHLDQIKHQEGTITDIKLNKNNYKIKVEWDDERIEKYYSESYVQWDDERIRKYYNKSNLKLIKRDVLPEELFKL